MSLDLFHLKMSKIRMQRNCHGHQGRNHLAQWCDVLPPNLRPKQQGSMPLCYADSNSESDFLLSRHNVSGSML